MPKGVAQAVPALQASRPVERLGRFHVERVLGKGAQGAVYLARDSKLERQVALKTLPAGAAPDEKALKALLGEALAVSRLAHPNIVALHDAFEADGLPCLVFEYVPGKTLRQLLTEEGKLDPARAARLAIDILRGLECAHAAGIVHRDLKPANILLTAEGVARVVDFGVARSIAGEGESPFAGAPGYMAPEYLLTRRAAPSNDVFAAGLVLHEMLTGRPAITGTTFFEATQRIVNEDLPPPSTQGAACDEALDAVVLKAVARDPAGRYPSAGAMADALARWLDPGAPSESAAAGTLEFILRRMRRKSDFPALSSTVSAINGAMASDTEPASRLCDGILRDFSLTQKLLRLVNAACYSQYGGGISTISRAVTILGFNGVRDAALTLMLLEHLGDRARADALKLELGQAYLSGVAARELARKTHSAHGSEEVFVCAMFHRLGRLLALFYLDEEFAAVEKLCAARGIDEERASREVLGLSYADLGLGVARKWNFPETIVSALRPIEDPHADPTLFRTQRNRVIAAMACEVSQAAREPDQAARDKRVAAIAERFAGSGLAASDLRAAVHEAAHVYARDAVALGLSEAPVAPFTRKAPPASDPGEIAATLPETTLTATVIDGGATNASPPAGPCADRQAMLAAGVQDITQVLVGEYALNDVLRIILETMYRAIGFRRVLLFVRDPKGHALRCRLGFGDNAAALCAEHFSMPAQPGRDIFRAALEKGADVCIEDVDSERIRAYVPDWFRAKAPAHSMILLPIAVNGKVVALIHADADRRETVALSHGDLSLLKTLRNQAILAIRSKG